MLRERYDPYSLFAAVPQLQLAFEPELAELDRRYRGLNPVRLKADIDAALELLWALADRGPVIHPSARRAAS